MGFVSELRECNKYVLKRCYNFIQAQDLAIPLLVSSDDNYIDGLNRKILYIGQETNCWLNYENINYMPDVEKVEQEYFDFLAKRCANNKDFWRFIRDCLEISREELSKNVIWNNTIISSKRTSIGNPKMTQELEDISIKYLIYLHDYFKPEYTIFVNGPKKPYLTITNEVLKNLGSDLVDNRPTVQNPVLIDSNKGVIWTYHPNYLNKSHLKDEVIQKVKKKIL